MRLKAGSLEVSDLWVMSPSGSMGTPRETPCEARVDDEVLEPAYSDLSLGPSGRPVATVVLEAMDPGVVTGGTGPGAAPIGAVATGTGPGETTTAAALEAAADSPMRLSTSLSSMERGRTVARDVRRRAPSTASAGTTDARLDRLTGLMEAMLVRMDDERRSQGGSHTTRASRASASRRSEPLGPWGGFGIGFSGSPGPAFSQLPPQQPWVPQGWMPVAVPGYELPTLQVFPPQALRSKVPQVFPQQALRCRMLQVFFGFSCCKHSGLRCRRFSRKRSGPGSCRFSCCKHSGFRCRRFSRKHSGAGCPRFSSCKRSGPRSCRFSCCKHSGLRCRRFSRKRSGPGSCRFSCCKHSGFRCRRFSHKHSGLRCRRFSRKHSGLRCRRLQGHRCFRSTGSWGPDVRGC